MVTQKVKNLPAIQETWVQSLGQEDLLEKGMTAYSSFLAWRIPWTIPLRGLEGVCGLPGAPQDEAGLTRKFETSHVGGATCRTPPIPRPALEKNPRPGPLFEGNPVGEGTTRRGTATPVHAILSATPAYETIAQKSTQEES